LPRDFMNSPRTGNGRPLFKGDLVQLIGQQRRHLGLRGPN